MGTHLIGTTVIQLFIPASVHLLGPDCGGVCQVEVASTILKLTGTDRHE